MVNKKVTLTHMVVIEVRGKFLIKVSENVDLTANISHACLYSNAHYSVLLNDEHKLKEMGVKHKRRYLKVIVIM